jgi:hypothetical protein
MFIVLTVRRGFFFRFEVLRAVMTLMMLFQVVTLCGLVGRYQLFGETYCLHPQG